MLRIRCAGRSPIRTCRRGDRRKRPPTSHRQEEQELAEIAEAQWEAFQDDHDTEFYDWVDEGIEDELDEHDLRVAQAEWEAEMNLENDLYMVYDDPDYWG